MILYIFTTALVLLIAYRWSRFLYTESFCDAISKVLLLSISIIVVLLTTAGFISIQPWFLVLIVLVLTAASEIVLRTKLRPAQPPPDKNEISPEEDAPPSRNACYWLSRLTPFAFIAIIVLILVILFIAGLFLSPRYTDELYYHIHFPLSCLQKGRVGFSIFGLSPSLSGVDAVPEFAFHYPKGYELIVLWNLLFTHSLRLAGVTSFWFFIAALCGFYHVLRRAGIDKVPALVGVVFVLTIPMSLKHLTTIYVDLAIASMCILAIRFLIEGIFDRRGDKRPWFWFALAVGWLPAIKYTGVVFALFLFAIAVAGLLIKKTDKKTIVNVVALVFISGLVLAGMWYGANLYYKGNPIAPYQVKVFGHVFIPGEEGIPGGLHFIEAKGERSSWGALWRNFKEPVTDVSMSSGLCGFGAHFLIIGIPSLLIIPLLLLTHGRWKTLHLVVAIVAIIGVVALQEYRWVSRFVLVLSFLGGIAVAMFIHAAPRWFKPIPILLFFAAVVFTYYYWLPYIPARFYMPEVWCYFLRSGNTSSMYFSQHPPNYTWGTATLKYGEEHEGSVNCLLLNEIRPPENNRLQFQHYGYDEKGVESVEKSIAEHDIHLVLVDMLSDEQELQVIVKWLEQHPEQFKKIWDIHLPLEFNYWTRYEEWMRIYEVVQ